MKMVRYLAVATLMLLSVVVPAHAQVIAGSVPNVTVTATLGQRNCFPIQPQAPNVIPVSPSILQTTGGCTSISQGQVWEGFTLFQATLGSLNTSGGGITVFIEDMTAGTYVAGCTVANGDSVCTTTRFDNPVAAGDILAMSIYAESGSSGEMLSSVSWVLY